ncbi:HAMP domain-containing sensor histidine kinase [uncultured Agrococcus sp.]|uniref:sensor histidine kinase n=1 Tax=uncultured Agrococcus sp. TaxID=382258 RepID=UPI0025DAA268|nr:HAMP domain-containing sensor histidine kinase [uncultured Agrococcus sp.]
MTVRTRIVGVVALLSLVGMLTAGATAYLLDRQRQLVQIDSNLDSALDAVHFLVGSGNWPSAEGALEAAVSSPPLDDNTGILGIVDGKPRLVPGIEMDLELQSIDGFVDRIVDEVGTDRAVRGTFAGEDGSVRYLAVPITVADASGAVSDPVIYVLGYDLDNELAELNDAAGIFLGASVLVTAIIVAVGLLVSGRLLRPIGDMSRMAQRISASNLGERIPVTGRDDVSQMAGTVNDMLDRLDAGLDSQRQLLQDVGHELNTPLTIVRGHLELMNKGDPDDVDQTRSLAIDELDRMAGLVNDIRDAAKLHDPKEFAFDRVEVDDLVGRIRAKAEAMQSVRLEPVAEAPAVSVIGDSNRLTQAVLQLVANAVKHGDGHVTFGARTARPGWVELFVRDRGQGVPDDQKQGIFDRFNRGADGGRGASGSGLGLAIVRAIADRHGGEVWVRDASPGAEFVIALPVSAAEQYLGGNEEGQWHQS